MKQILFVLLFGGLLLFVGCTYQQQPKYACPDGEEVSSPDLCTRYICSDGSVMYSAESCPENAEHPSPAVTQTPRTCLQQQPMPYCEGSSLYENFTCSDGTWIHSTRACEYGCANSSCITPSCPVCNDSNICTVDTCGEETRYSCSYEPLTNDSCAEGVRLCKPEPRPSSYVEIEISPGIISGVPKLGELFDSMTGQLFRVEDILINGTCESCDAEPILIGEPKVKLRVTNGVDGKIGSYVHEKSDVVRFCSSVRCKTSECWEYVCDGYENYTIKDIVIDAYCD